MARTNNRRFARPAAVLLVGSGIGCFGGSGPQVAPPGPSVPLTETTLHDELVATTDPASVGSVEGHVEILGSESTVAELGALVVVLEPLRKDAWQSPGPHGGGADIVRIESSSEAFDPPFSTVRGHQPVVFINSGPLKHQLFSTSLDERWSVDLDPGARSEPFGLPPQGPIRFFCSLHADESFVLYASDAEHIAVAGPTGEYRIESVRHGRYVLSIWSEIVEGPVREITVDGSFASREPIWLDPELIRR